MRRIGGRWGVLCSLRVLAAQVAGGQTVADQTLTVDTVLTQLAAPTSLAFLGPNDFLFLEKNTGRVRRVVNGVLQSAPVLDVAVNNNNERGLLGLVINSESPPRVFLYYTEMSDPDGDGLPDTDTGTPLGNRVYRYTWNAAPRISRTLLTGPAGAGGRTLAAFSLGPALMPSTPAIGDGRRCSS
jgi:glucose/arabinose dehydrogenase